MAERKKSDYDRKEEKTSPLVKKSSSRREDAKLPVDKGYAWIVCFANFSIMVVLMGTVRCFGIYLNELQKIFSTSSAMISTLLGVEYFANSISAFIVLNCLSTICSCRVLVLIGCILCSICFILDAFANSIIMLPFFHIINGVGIAFMFGPSIVIIGHYFKKYLGTANALTSCGSSVGQFMLSPIISLLLSTYGLKGALLINAGLFVQCIVFAMLLRPINFYIVNDDVQKIYDSTANEKSEETEDLLIKIEDMTFEKDLVKKRDPAIKSTSTEIEALKESSLSEQPLERCRTNNFSLITTNCENNCDIIHSGEKNMTSLIDLNSAKKDTETTPELKPFQNAATNSKIEPVAEKKTEILPMYKRILVNLSLNLFREKMFLVLFFGCTIAIVATSVPQTYFPAYSEDIGLGIKKGAYFVSMAGFADLGGRVLTTILADWKYLNRTDRKSVV